MTAANASSDLYARFGKSGIDKRESMAAFDILPKRVRAALREARHNWSAHAMMRLMRNGWSEDRVIAFIVENDAAACQPSRALEL
jgi:hypothetical protein